MSKFTTVIFTLALAVFFAAPVLRAQSTECTPEETAAPLQPTDPAYDAAIELARTLSEHRFTIKCVLTSKLSGLFDGVEGAALFRTSDGDFDALFLPKSRTFADLKIIERSLKKGFAYSFTGKPRPSANHLESVRREYFVKHDNQLIILNDDSMKAKLEDVLAVH